VRRPQLRSVQDLAAWTGRVLFLAGIFLMVTGDWPRFLLPSQRWGMPLSILAWPWLYLMLLAASFVLLVSGGVLRLARSTTTDFLHPPLALLTLTFLLSVAFSQAPLLSQWAFGCVLGLVGFTLAVARILEDETSMTWIPIVIAAAALFLAIRVILWRLDEGLIAFAFHVRNNAWLGKIQIAWVLNVIAPFLLAGFLRERRVVAAVSYGGAWLLSGAAIYVLFSKAGSLTFALTALSLCLLNARSWRRWLPPLVGVIGLVALITASPTMSTRLVVSLIHPDRDPGIAMRQGIWRQTLRMIVDRPVIGVGLGTYDDVAHTQYGPLADPHFFRNGWHAHNMFLHILAETGAVGFLAFCYLGFTIARFLFRRWRDDEGRGRPNSAAVLCFLLAFVVLSMTEAMIAARVHASLRMNLVLALLVIYGIRLASRPHAASTTRGGAS
jgi:O-antigen ligase